MESSGFRHLHVSGLPAECEDAEVEAALRSALLRPNRPAGKEASPAEEPASDGAEAPAGGDESKAADATDASQPTEKAEVAEARADDASAPNDSTSEAKASGGYVAEDPPAAQTETAPDAAEEAAEASAEEEEEEDPFVTCTVVRNKDTGACKGYCFLGFPSLADAEKAKEVINKGTIVAGSQVTAEVSQPKERHAKPKDPDEIATDLRLRRCRYNMGSKKKRHGHVTCSDKSKNIATKTGAINALVGTRGEKQPVFDDAKVSSKSGFACAK